MSDTEFAGTVLIADDDPQIIEVLTTILESENYNVISCDDGKEAVRLAHERRPDVMLLDMKMPRVDGFQALEQIKNNSDIQHTPVVMITGQADGDAKRRALEGGADDFITKPPQVSELQARVRSLAKVKAYYDQMHEYQKKLEEEVAGRTKELKKAMDDLTQAHEQLKASSFETTSRLARAAEFKDEDTAVHIRRMSRYAATIAREIGYNDRDAEELLAAAAMHDIGKIGVPEKILLKPGKLTESEWIVMQRHTTFGANILAESEYPLVQLGQTIARSHHEKWDGTGYPDALAGDDIPRVARIVAVADVFDALTSSRPYKDPLPVASALGIIRDSRGGHFEPAVVDAFFSCKAQILKIKKEHDDGGSESIMRQLNQAVP